MTGDNGIIQKAKQAKIETEIATEKEQVQMSYLACKMEDYQNNVTKQAMQEELDKQVGENKTKVTSRGENLIIEFLESQRVYQIDQNGNITEAEKPSGIDDEIGMDGDGTKENPYSIMSIEDLFIFSMRTNTGETFEENFIELGRDLNFLDDNSYIDPNADIGELIGEENMGKTTKEVLSRTFFSIAQTGEFLGNFDGKNYKISNFTITDDIYSQLSEPDLKLGLFINNKGTIANLCLENIEYKIQLSESCDITGICAINNGSIINCKVSGVLKLNGIFGNISGICDTNSSDGYNGTIYGCSNDMNIEYSTTAETIISGICATNSGYIIDCKNSGNITGEMLISENNIQTRAVEAKIIALSGIVSENYGVAIGSYNLGKLEGKSIENITINGIAGVNIGGAIYSCYNIGNLAGEANIYEYISGIVHENNGIVENCYNAGILSGERNAGLVSYNVEDEKGEIINSYWQTGTSDTGGYTNQFEPITGDIELSQEEMKNNDFLEELNNNLKNPVSEAIKVEMDELTEILNIEFIKNPEINPEYPVIQTEIK